MQHSPDRPDQDRDLDDDLDEMAHPTGVDPNDLALMAEEDEASEDADVEEDDDEWPARRGSSAQDEDDEWMRDAWTDYMNTRAAVRSDGGQGGGFFYE